MPAYTLLNTRVGLEERQVTRLIVDTSARPLDSRPIHVCIGPADFSLCAEDAAAIVRALKAALRQPPPAAQLKRHREIFELRRLAKKLKATNEAIYLSARHQIRSATTDLDDLRDCDPAAQIPMLYERLGAALANRVILGSVSESQ